MSPLLSLERAGWLVDIKEDQADEGTGTEMESGKRNREKGNRKVCCYQFVSCLYVCSLKLVKSVCFFNKIIFIFTFIKFYSPKKN